MNFQKDIDEIGLILKKQEVLLPFLEEKQIVVQELLSFMVDTSIMYTKQILDVLNELDFKVNLPGLRLQSLSKYEAKFYSKFSNIPHFICTLNFKKCGLTNQEVISLASFLSESDSIQEINLHMNRFDERGVMEISSALKQNNSLKSLNLSENEIYTEGGISIGEALKENTSLEKLFLSNTYIGPHGGTEIIFEALKENNSTLQELDLSGNFFQGLMEVEIFGEALIQNNSLRVLSLKRNNITCEDAIKIGEALKLNHSLRKLDLCNNILQTSPLSSFPARSGFQKKEHEIFSRNLKSLHWTSKSRNQV